MARIWLGRKLSSRVPELVVDVDDVRQATVRVIPESIDKGRDLAKTARQQAAIGLMPPRAFSQRA